MMRNIKNLATLFLLAGSVNAMASDFDNVSGTLSWTIGNESTATATEAIASAVLSSSVTVGTDLTVSTYDAASNGGGTLATYQPGTSNPGFAVTDMVEYTITLQKGLTLTVSDIAFDAVKQGTDGAYFSWSYAVDDVAGDTVIYSDPKNQILRNNNANADVAQLTHNETISNPQAGRTFKLRFYMSNVANNKKMSIGNIKINAVVNGTVEVRAFTNFKIDFRSDPYTVVEPATGLPQGVTVEGGTFHDTQHGYSNAVVKVTVDGPVKFYVGGCGYSNQATVTDAAGNTLAIIDTKGAGCDTNTSYDHYATWVYNSETPETLTFNLGSYCPFFYAEACELIPMCNVRYYDVDGKTVIGEETVQGNSPLVYKYGAADVTIAEGYAFRGWFNSTQSSAVKVAEGTAIQDNLNLYAKATEIENPTNTSRYIYELNKANFYVEDHEAIEIQGGSFHDTQHGWSFGDGGTISLKVAGKALVMVGNCKYSSDCVATVTDAAGNTVSSFNVKVDTDGAESTVKYDGPATTLTITFSGTTYIHKVTVYNVVDFVQYDETSGYYIIPANDANSFLLALATANGTGDTKIFLPNGTYDLGQLCLTSISGNNISIVGESMDSTIIRNAPLVENEGIGTTATLLNTSNNLYLQDLTLQNALDYYAAGSAGRAVCLQDKGQNTICKNVKMLSYQDTYYSNRASNFYWEDSEIHGTVDYLCGDGNVVYNRVHFVNESRARDSKSGSDVLCAPYSTATTPERYNWGYVFLDCSVESLCNDFTFARAWGGEAKAQFLRTTIIDGSLNAARFTAAGMNVAASSFKEYKSLDADGNVISPASNIMTFTHSSGNKTYETIMTDDEASQFTIQNIYGDWAPDQKAAQVEIADKNELPTLAPAYLVSADGVETVLVPAATVEDAITNAVEATNSQVPVLVRASNGRGGFGPAFTAFDQNAVNIDDIEDEPANTTIYNLYGQRINEAKGICIINGKKVIK